MMTNGAWRIPVIEGARTGCLSSNKVCALHILRRTFFLALAFYLNGKEKSDRSLNQLQDLVLFQVFLSTCMLYKKLFLSSNMYTVCDTVTVYFLPVAQLYVCV